jgi:hypothetical protein
VVVGNFKTDYAVWLSTQRAAPPSSIPPTASTRQFRFGSRIDSTQASTCPSVYQPALARKSEVDASGEIVTVDHEIANGFVAPEITSLLVVAISFRRKQSKLNVTAFDTTLTRLMTRMDSSLSR